MEVSGQLHSPVALPPGKDTPVHIRRLGGLQSRCEQGGEEKKIPAPAEKRTPVVQFVVQSLY
jgi:hypothetical protein